MTRSGFRFLSSNRGGQYSVWHGDRHIGYVTKVVHRISDRGVTRMVVAGWTPSTTNRTDLAIAPTREAAANVLWQHRS
jgi:hypothetical protein